MPKIFDCFLFFNELDLLEIRLNVLAPIVDYFVILESNRTFTNKPKELFFFNNRERFKNFSDKLRYYCLKDYNKTEYRPFVKACASRNFLFDAFCKESGPDDIYILSDLDEIPNPELIQNYFKLTNVATLSCEMLDFCYYINTVHSKDRHWIGSVIGKIKNRPKKIDYGQPNDGFQYIMEMRRKFLRIPESGWHYSYLNDWKGISEKTSAICDTETDIPEINNPKNIKNCVDNLIAFAKAGKQDKLDIIELNELTCPKFLLENLSKYSNFICKKK